IGADHILFLISLLLPCVFLRESAGLGHWRASQQLRSSLISVLAVVTAFTVAHSITLALTVLEVISPPAGLVEPIIAASVIVAALGNLTKTLIHLRWQIAFLFGLIHGFGFASVLADLGLPSDQLASALLGFNLGVEFGQLAIVALFFPIAWRLRATAFYRWGVVFGGSILIAVIASYWLIERLS
ncbi:MAG: HupE/UreJ family protein, partial [Proteobacteria bacterium]|nr:HupE/UreJ family protein [Pseudomonadota bacterium]